MEMSTANENGVYKASHSEIVASHGRCFAAIQIAFCDDGQYRFSTSMQYSYGGFGGPVFASCEGYDTFAAARTAAIEELLKRWHTPFHSEPQSARDELRLMREQIEGQLRQPSLI